jgi:hypothetical protein
MPRLLLLALLVPAACAPAPAPAPDHDAAVAACAAAVAAHVGKPVAAVEAGWAQATADGGIVTVTDVSGAGGERLHTCEVDASGRVRAILHPGA